MYFKPHDGYRTYKLPMFIIHADDRALTVASGLDTVTVRRFDEWKIPGCSFYSCVSPDELLLYGDPTMWEVRTWQGKISSLSYAGQRIYPLTAEGWTPDILTLFDYLDDMGIAASGLNTMSVNLWRTTLQRTVSFSEQANSIHDMLGPVCIKTGGRKEARPGQCRNVREYDITAAYPDALARINLPTQLAGTLSLSRMGRQYTLSRSCVGIGRAKIRIPTLDYGPVPVLLDGVTCYGWTGGKDWTDVCLPLSELRMAESVGCDVIVTDVRMGINAVRPFVRWYDTIVPTVRNLPGIAGTLGKLITNRLWSCFAVAIDGERRTHRFDGDGKMVTEIVQPDHERRIAQQAGTAYVGAFVQSAVRQRLYMEGIRQIPGVVYVDTDGLIANPTDKPLPAGWRTKTVMRSCDIAGPQCMTYYCDRCDGHSRLLDHRGPHWTVAGAQTLEAKSRLFAAVKAGAMMVTANPTVPPQNVTANALSPDPTETSQTSFYLTELRS